MSSVRVTEILIELIKVSEKAAKVARLCRAEEELFQLLVQEKSGESKNPRFVQDFKTLADVLVQETIKHDLSSKFQGVDDRIYGEENNKFENSLGEAVVVSIQNSCQSTSSLLLRVLDGNKKAADLLAHTVHDNQIELTDHYLDALLEENFALELNIDEIGIWIDPIDSTSEYVNGVWETDNNKTEGIITSGLQCVTSLIGVFDTRTGLPLIGIANQPFISSINSYHELRYTGRYYWGFDINGVRKNNFSDQIELKTKGVVLIGGNETQKNINALKDKNKVVYAAGAGNKLLMTTLALADTYVNSKPSTYRWDTCGPHAILRSIGGGIISFNDAIALGEEVLNQLNDKQLCYSGNEDNKQEPGINKWCNTSGIVAYNSVQSLNNCIIHLLSN